MGLTLSKALRLSYTPRIAFVGAGGKTSAMFKLGRELLPPVIVTSTTHLGSWQIPLADHHIMLPSTDEFTESNFEGVTLITGPINKDDRIESIGQEGLKWLRAKANLENIPLLIEADGARQKPLKAPKEHEPPIPDFIENVLVVTGLSAIGKPLSEDTVYNPVGFSKLSGLPVGQLITPDAIVRVLCHLKGGQKNIPADARRTLLLNQSDTPELQSIAHGMVPLLLSSFDSVIISSLNHSNIYAAHEPVGGIILAAGGSKRYGSPKQLLDWHGSSFIYSVVRTALASGLSRVVVVTGADAEKVEEAIKDLPVIIKRNRDWQSGQASSIRAGISALTTERCKPIGAAVFLLADQPQIEPSVITALVENHAVQLNPIIAPLVMMEKRANPVLFDQVTFPDLMELQGDIGGRAIFSKHPVEYMPWHDDRLLLDVDDPEDYQRLIGDDSL